MCANDTRPDSPPTSADGPATQAVTHELNEALTAVAAYLAAMRLLLAEGDRPRMEQAIGRAAEQVERAARCVQQLRRESAPTKTNSIA